MIELAPEQIIVNNLRAMADGMHQKARDVDISTPEGEALRQSFRTREIVLSRALSMAREVAEQAAKDRTEALEIEKATHPERFVTSGSVAADEGINVLLKAAGFPVGGKPLVETQQSRLNRVWRAPNLQIEFGRAVRDIATGNEFVYVQRLAGGLALVHARDEKNTASVIDYARLQIRIEED